MPEPPEGTGQDVAPPYGPAQVETGPGRKKSKKSARLPEVGAMFSQGTSPGAVVNVKHASAPAVPMEPAMEFAP